MVAVIKAIFDALSGGITSVFEGLSSAADSFGKKEHTAEYNASFASPSTILSRWNLGFSLAGGLRATCREIATRNALVVGPSGSGKSSTVLIGSVFTLARGGASMCIMDVSGELFKLTSGWLHKKGYKIYCINFGNTSDSFNFLLLCKSVTDIQKVAFLLIKNSGIESKADPYWSVSAEMMLAIFMEYLVLHAAPEYCTVVNLVRLVDTFAGSPKFVDLLFVKAGNDDLFARYKAMNAVSEKTLQSTLATVRSAIKVFATPALKHCTATNTVDFSAFRKEKSVLYICTPITDVDFYAPLSALLFEALFKEMMSKVPDKTDKHVFCLMDELMTMRFQNLGLVFSNCRKYALGCMGVIQDEKMLEITMSPAEAHAIKTNCYAKVYLPGQPEHTCTMLQNVLGKYTVVDESAKTERVRWLRTSSEIRMSNEAIILAGNLPPVSVRLVSYYSHWILSRRTKLPPYELTVKTASDPPLLPFQ